MTAIELAPLYLLAGIALLLFTARMLAVARFGWRSGGTTQFQNRILLVIALIGLGVSIPYMLWVAHRQAPPGAMLDTSWLPYIGWAVVAFLVYLALFLLQRRKAG